MGRRKQSRPNRSGGKFVSDHSANQLEAELERSLALGSEEARKNELDGSETDQPYFVEVHGLSGLGSGSDESEHLDISEIVLLDLSFGERFSEGFFAAEKYALRLRLQNNLTGRAYRTRWHHHWPVLSSADVFLEFVEKGPSEDELETVLSGRFDGPDEGVSGLAHLVSLKFVALRPVVEEGWVSKEAPSVRLRVEILRNALEACESLLENTCKVWRKSMKNVMAWLRPEVVTSEARYGVSVETGGDSNTELDGRRRSFDVAGFYEAIKPSKTDAMLEVDLPDLVPELRPYQRRAAHWMVQREKGFAISKPSYEEDPLVSPWCLPVEFLSGNSKMFYNPFSGKVSLKPDRSSERVPGGILADEMGLGKTVELLACVLAHPKEAYEDSPVNKDSEDTRVLRRLKKERVECVCGAVSENHRYKGMWVQCDMCNAWQHADCVAYSVKGKPIEFKEVTKDGKGRNRKKNATIVAERDGEYICQRCSELKQAVESPVPSGATLIVCPAPILPQWRAEITCHTRPGALKTLIYDGVREASLANSAGLDIEELVNADIVLTTYDVLREDLSHDSDRHDGDRRFLRFQKRYPVIPTHLTRISWWRVCLDEAQMVESSSTAATEMAQRLHAKYRWCITGTPIQRKLDDLYGLLRFLKASPFDVSRWWVDIMRDPYEGKDAGAMKFTHKFFKQIMWRSSKAHVADELQLPPQEDCTSWLSFSPVEEHFYLRQHESCASFACEIIESLRNDLLKREASGGIVADASSDHFITHADAGKLLNTLLKLRQACCHPQVGSSGLRSLQQSPMTMEEILMVLISKTKKEGEESLRRLVLSLNGLAGIAMIQGNTNEAASLYKEGLAVAEEHSDDFRLDPLVNIHIFHNLSEILPQVDECPVSEKGSSRIAEKGVLKRHGSGKFENVFKRRKLSAAGDDGPEDNTTDIKENGSSVNLECDDAPETSGRAIGGESLRVACDSVKQKFLTVFNSRLYTAQEDFQKSYMQVCSAIDERKNQDKSWWMDGLIHAEQDDDLSTELIRKIEEAISASVNNSKSSGIPTGFQSISGLKYHIQSGLDELEECRNFLLDQLLAIDKTMEKPKEEDILRVRFCQKCQVDGDGPLCVMCELDDLFQNYEARLFRLNKAQGGTITSAEEAVDLQKKNSALNRYYWTLTQPNKTSNLSGDGHEESRKRDVREKIVVSKSPSELEVVLGVIKNHCRAYLGRDIFSAATKHLHMLEGMRKEYAHSRALAVAQAQVLQAHDEIKMATTRLELRVEDDDESLNALSEFELASASVQYTSDKFVAVNMLSSVKGKLRYLQGLVEAKKNLPSQNSDNPSPEEEALSTTASVCSGLKSQCMPKANDESCPVCQELLSARKMVFQCGHVTCCKCLIVMTERRVLQDNEAQRKWIKCPTCRQRTDFGNIAYVDDRQNESCTSLPTPINGPESWGASIVVQGSYGTKIEAVTRRVLWIKSKDPEEKVLVFSSWNDVLDVLEHAFTANDISFIRMKGGRKAHVAITEFTKEGKHGKENSSVQVLLLLIQHGANGLNLLEAQHVVLVEPLLNPAAEAQAISRVHRIGQQNKTLVHRFIVKDTVEESIYKLNRSKSTTVFISGNTKNQDQPFLTLKDIESLFATSPSSVPSSTSDDKSTECLMHLPPSVAAAIAAEKRLNTHKPSSSGEAVL